MRVSKKAESLDRCPDLVGKGLPAAGMSAVFIFLLTFLVYTPALDNDFVNFDDDEYIYENTHITSLDPTSLHWMLITFHSSNWHPLTWLSHAVDYALWGLNPLGHHLTNIILHGLNAAFVFLLVRRLGRHAANVDPVRSPFESTRTTSPQGFIAAGVTAILFGLHPLRVESVAWVAERKDLLCAFFVFLSIGSYLSYTASAVKKHRMFWYVACLILFGFSLMTKPMAVTLPMILLLFDIYPLKRVTRSPFRMTVVLVEKLPFFILSMASSLVTVIAQHGMGAIIPLEALPVGVRILNALNSVFFYLKKMAWPVELVPHYPFPKYSYPFDARLIVLGIVFLAITGSFLWMVKRRNYFFFTSWSYYLITLLPVLGIVQVGTQAAADRYTYLPSLGPFVFIGAGTAWIWGKLRSSRRQKQAKFMIVLVLCVMTASLGRLTVRQIRIWEDSETLWRHVIRVFPEAGPSPYNNLAWFYATSIDESRRNGEAAVALATKACAFTKFKVPGHLDTLAAAYAETGNFQMAIEVEIRAIQLAGARARPGFMKRLELFRAGEPYRSR